MNAASAYPREITVGALEQVGNYWPVAFLVTRLSGEDLVKLATSCIESFHSLDFDCFLMFLSGLFANFCASGDAFKQP